MSVYPRGQSDGLGPLLDKLANFERRLKELESASGTQAVGLTSQVRTQLAALDGRMTAAEADINAAEADINSLDTRVTDLETP